MKQSFVLARLSSSASAGSLPARNRPSEPGADGIIPPAHVALVNTHVLDVVAGAARENAVVIDVEATCLLTGLWHGRALENHRSVHPARYVAPRLEWRGFGSGGPLP